MTTITTDNWYTANQRYLMAVLAVVRGALERQAGQGPSLAEKETQDYATAAVPPEATSDLPVPSALEILCATFGLSTFERDVLLLCAGMELDSSFGSLCAAAQGDPARAYPTISLALAALANPHWNALTPDAPLRYWRLIEVGPGSTLTLSPLHIDERVLHYLAGLTYLDERLVGLIVPVRAAGVLAPSYQALVEQMVGAWSRAAGDQGLPIIQLCGNDLTGKQTIAAAACAALGLNLSVLAADLVPTGSGDLNSLLRLWEREAALSGSALLLDCDDLDTLDITRASAVMRLIDRTQAALIVTSREPRRSPHRPVVSLDVPKPSMHEQRVLWRSALGQETQSLNGQVDALVSQFSLNPSAIYSATAEALTRGPDNFAAVLWDACRRQTRPRMDELAQRIEPAAEWDDLILPEEQRRTLRDIVAHVKQRATVYETWGFGAKGARGLGISALFAGASGTGKTLAAEILAHELRLDLYRIDLSQVVSKYIGETEKNLRRVFDIAEEGGAVLLFDEADALFGKRSEVKDSHDRYANIEVSYLLQRMEVYRGLAILTSNMKSALDNAFLRRIRFVIQFPFPDATHRIEIWRRIFPASTPTEDLDVGKLARLNVSGGNIRNIALNAAFLAAEAKEPIRMAHLFWAAQGECAKLEKPVTDAEIGGWI